MRTQPAPVIGVSSAIQRARQLVERYARTQLPILLQGATGTGKDLFAQHVHYLSGRPGIVVDVNCGALPREMVESLLFGHCKGAFTGAHQSATGHIERAHGGTLFLDELLDLPLESQVKLLRVLETGEVQRLGDSQKKIVDLRIVAAVQDDLAERLDRGAFRGDVFQRIAGVVIRLPPLAERPEDVLPLSRHFAALQERSLEPEAERVLEGYGWPGNARELRIAIERAGYLVDDGTLPASAVTEAIELGAPPKAEQPRRCLTASPHERRKHLLAVCEANQWDATRSAGALHVGLSTFYRQLRTAGIALRDMRQRNLSQFSQRIL